MGNRRQPRVPKALTVSVCGMDAKGRAFLEQVRTRNISRDGAQVEGALGGLNVGDSLALRCEGSTTRFRAIWESGTGRSRTVGLARFGSSALPVDCELPASAPDDYLRPRVMCRREQLRYKSEISVELKVRDTKSAMWVTTSDIGEGGCRLQVPQMVPLFSEVNVALWLDDIKVWVEGTVTHSLYGWGTGICFRGLQDMARERLARIIEDQGCEVSDRRVGPDASSLRAGLERIAEASRPVIGEDPLLALLLER